MDKNTKDQSTISKKNNCLVCGHRLTKSKLDGLVECKTCGFITADCRMSDDDFAKLYTKDYFHGEEYANYVNDKDILQKNFKKRIKTLKKYSGDLTGKSVFEIGSAYGFFLDVLKRERICAKGIDISEDAVKSAKNDLKVEAVSGDYLDYIIDNQVDVVCMWDTIEHLQYPEKYIEKCYKHIKKKGMLCITTGDIGSLNAKIRGGKWRQIHPPTHLHYFSKNTITRLLKKHGFKVIQISYPSNFISINTIAYTILVLKWKKKGLYEFLKKTQLTKLELPFNFHDFMYVIAVKL